MPSISRDSRTVSYIDSGGDDPAVVLLHAFPLNSGQWEGQVESLADRYRFICPDFQGFGSSTAPEDESSYSLDGFADDVAAILDELNLDKVVLVGLSMGGYTAFAFLRRHRERVSALVLADAKAEADPPEGKEKRTNQQAQVRAEGTAGLIEGLSGALLGEPTREKKPDVVAATKKLMAENPPAGFIGALEAMKNRPDSSGELGQIGVPTLIIVGEN
ncbi:MAG: alpha/beta hydrolase, partial [Actinobacteria bacterium]|nr:alpha/beta hydrolase [Actinomycetota bacterium]